jgi:hypothetical protein
MIDSATTTRAAVSPYAVADAVDAHSTMRYERPPDRDASGRPWQFSGARR